MSTPRFRLGALAAQRALGGDGARAERRCRRSPHDGVDHGDEITATTWSNYEKVTLTKDVGEPIDMAVLPDRAC